MLVAANRDEFLDRASAPPQVLTSGARRVIAPVDLVAGGTWLALNDSGVFVGITNRRATPHDPTRASRGRCVIRAAAEATAEAAARVVAQDEGTAYNGFHLVCADATSVWRVIGDGERLHLDDLGAGVHVVTERSLAGKAPARETTLRNRIERLGSKELDTLAPLLVDHSDDAVEGTCVHIDARGYGTRSSTLVALGESPESTRLMHADGPPCQTSYQDCSALLVPPRG